MTQKIHKDYIYQIETNIDDMNPQIYGGLMDRLFAKGALDVFWTSVQMKRNRPGTMITILCTKKKLEDMIEILFAETTTFGLRYWPVERRILDRKTRTVTTPYGRVKVKVGNYKGKVYTINPEYEDCRRLANRKKIPVKKILSVVEKKSY